MSTDDAHGIDRRAFMEVLTALIEEVTPKAFEAGAHGIVASREYEEMKAANLRAVGRAYRDVMARIA